MNHAIYKIFLILFVMFAPLIAAAEACGPSLLSSVAQPTTQYIKPHIPPSNHPEPHMSVLHSAAAAGDLQQVRHLLASGMPADYQAVWPHIGFTALFAIASYGPDQNRLACARELLEHGANPNMPGIHYYRPLHYTVRFNNLELAQLLLEYGADKALTDATKHQTPLQIAQRYNNKEFISLLAAAQRAQDCDAASTQPDDHDLKHFLKYGDTVGRKKSIDYVDLDDDEISVLIKPFDPVTPPSAATKTTEAHESPLFELVASADNHITSSAHRMSACSFFLPKQYQEPVSASPAFSMAEYAEEYEGQQATEPGAQASMTEQPQQSNAQAAAAQPIITNSKYPLISAAIKGDKAEIEESLLKGVPVNQKMGSDVVGFTALGAIANLPFSAAHFECAAALLQAGANPNIPTTHGLRPLHLAVHKNNIQLVVLLITNNADTKVRENTYNNTPLQEAIRLGKEDIAEIITTLCAMPQGHNSAPLLNAFPALPETPPKEPKPKQKAPELLPETPTQAIRKIITESPPKTRPIKRLTAQTAKQIFEQLKKTKKF